MTERMSDEDFKYYKNNWTGPLAKEAIRAREAEKAFELDARTHRKLYIELSILFKKLEAENQELKLLPHDELRNHRHWDWVEYLNCRGKP